MSKPFPIGNRFLSGFTGSAGFAQLVLAAATANKIAAVRL
jgi:hypothetical protein